MAIEIQGPGETGWTPIEERIDIDDIDIDTVDIEGVLVWRAEIPIDVFDRIGLGYDITDTGQSTLPMLVSGGYDNYNALRLPPNNPNSVTNLSPANPGYGSSDQTIDLPNYLEPGTIAEIYMRPASTWAYPAQFRFGLFTDGVYPGTNHIRLRFSDGGSDGYWRLEQGSSLYDGTGASESFNGFNAGRWHRLVIDASAFPEIYCHLWDADTGAFLDTVGGAGDGNPNTAGHYWWFNDDVEMLISDYRIIDGDDFSPGDPL